MKIVGPGFMFAEHDRGNAIPGDTKDEGRNPGPTECGVVRGRALDDAFHVPGPELLGRLRKAFRYSVADPSRDVGTGARERADDRADDVAAQLLADRKSVV